MYPTDNRRLGRFLRKAAADHFRRHHHLTSSCCPWQSGPCLRLAKGEGGMGDLECGAKAAIWQQQDTYFPRSLSALGMLCPGQNPAAQGTAQGVPTDELL